MPQIRIRLGVPSVHIAEQGDSRFEELSPTTGGVTFLHAVIDPDNCAAFNTAAIHTIKFKLLQDTHPLLDNFRENSKKHWQLAVIMPPDMEGVQEVVFLDHCKLLPVEQTWTKNEVTGIPLTFETTDKTVVVRGKAQ